MPKKRCSRCNARVGEWFFKSEELLICSSCAESMGWLSVNRCGQGCTGRTDRGFPSKPVHELKKGDVLPACGHRVRVRIVRFIRSEIAGSRHIFEVIPLGISKNIFETSIYGDARSLIDVEK